jgi:hypothetical protein
MPGMQGMPLAPPKQGVSQFLFGVFDCFLIFALPLKVACPLLCNTLEGTSRKRLKNLLKIIFLFKNNTLPLQSQILG